jgi:cyclic beta-1,2-glucan synthetase
VVLALARLGRGDDAWACLDLLNPVRHALTKEDAEHYRTEPYVVAADVYGEGERTGQGGWTWYTGSAGWLYRAAVEGILGIRKEGGRLFVDPVLPSAWNGYTATLVLDGRKLSIRVDRAEEGGWRASVNGSVIKSSNEGYLL